MEKKILEAVTPPPAYTALWPSIPEMELSQSTSGQTASSHLFCVAGKTPTMEFRISEFDSKLRGWRSVYVDNSNRLITGMASVGDKLYIAGGYNFNKGSSIYTDYFLSFNCRTRQIVQLPVINDSLSHYGLASLGGALYRSGGILKTYNSNLQGNEYEKLSSAYRYNPENHRWDPIANMTQPRSGHHLLTGNGVLYAVGGDRGGEHSIEKYNSEANAWIRCPIRYLSHNGWTATFHQGSIYLCGEQFFHKIDPESQEATRKGLLLPPNSRANSLVSYGGKLLSVGGCEKDTTKKTAMVFEFEERTGSWIRQPDMDVKRKRHGCVVANY